MSRKDISWVEFSKVNLIVEWRLSMKSFMDWSCSVVPRKVKEDIVYESLPEGDGPDEGFPDGFFVATHEKVGVWWGAFGSHGCADELEKMLVHE